MRTSVYSAVTLVGLSMTSICSAAQALTCEEASQQVDEHGLDATLKLIAQPIGHAGQPFYVNVAFHLLATVSGNCEDNWQKRSFDLNANMPIVSGGELLETYIDTLAFIPSMWVAEPPYNARNPNPNIGEDVVLQVTSGVINKLLGPYNLDNFVPANVENFLVELTALNGPIGAEHVDDRRSYNHTLGTAYRDGKLYMINKVSYKVDFGQ